MNRVRFIAFLRRPGIFKLLVRLLSNSLSLRRLSIGLNVEVLANYHCHFDDLSESDEERDFKGWEQPTSERQIPSWTARS